MGISVYGLFKGLSNNINKSLNGLTIELSGLSIALGGLLSYFIIQFSLSFLADGDQRYALTAFAYTMSAFLVVRIVGVRLHRQKVMS